MMGTRILVALVGGFAVLALAGPACAGSITVTNDTAIVAYSGTSPTAYFAGPNPYVSTTSIGSNFDTSSLTVQTTPVAGGKVDLMFSYVSQFSGPEIVNNVQVAAADIFLAPGGGGYTYGISLGEQGQNGGVAAGFYQVTSSETSQQIWGGRPGFTYGGGIASSTQYEPGQAGYNAMAMPTVITGGKLLGGATVATLSTGGGWYDWNVSVQLTAQQAAAFDQGFNVFWGTGDCANGAFLANIAPFAVPEAPSALLLLPGLSLLLAFGRGARSGATH